VKAVYPIAQQQKQIQTQTLQPIYKSGSDEKQYEIDGLSDVIEGAELSYKEYHDRS